MKINLYLAGEYSNTVLMITFHLNLWIRNRKNQVSFLGKVSGNERSMDLSNWTLAIDLKEKP
jgi:hypothetical protein